MPDLYGPFWIVTTLVVMLAITGPTAKYFCSISLSRTTPMNDICYQMPTNAFHRQFCKLYQCDIFPRNNWMEIRLRESDHCGVDLLHDDLDHPCDRLFCNAPCGYHRDGTVYYAYHLHLRLQLFHVCSSFNPVRCPNWACPLAHHHRHVLLLHIFLAPQCSKLLSSRFAGLGC